MSVRSAVGPDAFGYPAPVFRKGRLGTAAFPRRGKALTITLQGIENRSGGAGLVRAE